MKRLLISVILAVVMIISTFAKTNIVAEGKTHTSMGDYQITVCDEPCILNGKELSTFTVMYENSEILVQIAVQKRGKATVYVVTSEELSVEYVQSNRRFGIGDIIESKDINRQAYYQQKVLTHGQSQKGSLGLIAAYFPYLLG